jgi:hypothetical protein
MNTRALARLYDGLTPWERVPLILAASSRGDAQERARLTDSAPRDVYRIPDYHGLAEGMRQLAQLHVMRQLEAAALYWQASGLLDRCAARAGTEDGKAVEARTRRALRGFAYVITVYADAWKRLYHEMQADTDVLLKYLPGRDVLRQAEEAARAIAPSAEEVTAWLRARGDLTTRPVTVDSVLRDMRDYLQDHLDWWSDRPTGRGGAGPHVR